MGSGRGGWPTVSRSGSGRGCAGPPGDAEGRPAVTGTLIVPVVDEGLGNSAYLVDLGDGRALAVDVPRDLRAARAAASRHGLRIAFAADTHLHADFLSGALQLSDGDGPLLLASAPGVRGVNPRLPT